MGFQNVRLIPVLLALLAPAAECQSTGDLWRFVPPDAKALVSIQWQRIRESPALATLRQKLLTDPAARTIPGLDLLDEVDRILVTSSGMPQPAASDASAGAPADAPANTDQITDTPVLIVFRGRFETSKVRHFFSQIGARPQAYNNFQVYRPQNTNTKQMAWVQFDSSTVLFGDAPSLFAALDRNRFAPPAPQPGSIIARAAEMESTYDFWISVQSPDLVSRDQLAGLVPQNVWGAEMKGFEAGISLRSGMAADFTMQLDSEAAAKKMVADFAGAVQTALREKGADPQMRELASKIHMAAEGPYAKVNLHLTQEDLRKTAEAYAAAYQRGVTAAQQSARPPAVSAPRPVPPQRGVIRIEGLDNGPVDIPYPPPQP